MQLGGLSFLAILSSIADMVKESREKTIPAENWANKDLYHQDMANGTSVKQRMKNLENGKYKLVQSTRNPAGIR